MIERNYKLIPEHQDSEDADLWTAMLIAPENDAAAGGSDRLCVRIDLEEAGPGGSGKTLATLQLTPLEAQELASVLKILGDPDGNHSPEDLLNAGMPI